MDINIQVEINHTRSKE